jgi:hypothetical protein
MTKVHQIVDSNGDAADLLDVYGLRRGLAVSAQFLLLFPIIWFYF